MNRLYLVRHGESLSGMAGDQPLSPKGIKETERVAALFKMGSFELDEIIHSTKKRARETAEIFGKIAAPDLALIQREDLAPMDPIEPILEEIKILDRNVMIVGHLPFMERLLSSLLTGQEGLCPVIIRNSTVIGLEGDGRSWRIEWVLSAAFIVN